MQIFSEQTTLTVKSSEVLEELYGKIFMPCKNFRGLEYAAGFLETEI